MLHKICKSLVIASFEGVFTIHCGLNGILIVIFFCKYLIGRRHEKFEQETINLIKNIQTQDTSTITQIFDKRQNSRLLVPANLSQFLRVAQFRRIQKIREFKSTFKSTFMNREVFLPCFPFLLLTRNRFHLHNLTF